MSLVQPAVFISESHLCSSVFKLRAFVSFKPASFIWFNSVSFRPALFHVFQAAPFVRSKLAVFVSFTPASIVWCSSFHQNFCSSQPVLLVQASLIGRTEVAVSRSSNSAKVPLNQYRHLFHTSSSSLSVSQALSCMFKPVASSASVIVS